jgi:hypothetical protein
VPEDVIRHRLEAQARGEGWTTEAELQRRRA